MDDNVVVIIPAYKSSNNLVSFVQGLIIQNNLKIVVVDDGSGAEYESIFDQLKNIGVIVLHHDKNLGKGRALKTAFNYCLNNFDDVVGVVTADDDGQHLQKDVLRVIEALKQTIIVVPNKNNLILGARQLDKKVPLRSKFGNFITRNIFYLVTGQKLSDTQTGLRGIPFVFLQNLLNIKGDRYEYEMNVLLSAKKLGMKIIQIPISTVYIKGNKSSHFNPIKDSFKIYSSIIKFIFTGK